MCENENKNGNTILLLIVFGYWFVNTLMLFIFYDILLNTVKAAIPTIADASLQNFLGGLNYLAQHEYWHFIYYMYAFTTVQMSLSYSYSLSYCLFFISTFSLIQVV